MKLEMGIKTIDEKCPPDLPLHLKHLHHQHHRHSGQRPVTAEKGRPHWRSWY